MKRLLLACTALGLFSAPAFRAQDSPNNPSAPAARSARRADKNAAKAGGGAPRFPSDLKIVQNVVFFLKHLTAR